MVSVIQYFTNMLVWCTPTIMINLMLNIHKRKISKNVKSQNFLRGRKLKNPNYATLFSILRSLKVHVVIEQLKKKAGVLWLIHHYRACTYRGKDGVQKGRGRRMWRGLNFKMDRRKISPDPHFQKVLKISSKMIFISVWHLWTLSNLSWSLRYLIPAYLRNIK